MAPTSPEIQQIPTGAKAGVAPGRSSRTVLMLAALLLVTLAAAWLRIEVGPLAFGWPTGSQATVDSALADRTTKLVDDVLVGVALAVSGVCLQAVLRNPLAEPFILGLSTGAGVGVMLETLLIYHLHRQFGGNQVGALVGAGLTMVIVYTASRRRGVIDPLGLLLIGVVVSTINGAIIMFIQYVGAGPGGIKENLSRWMAGNIDEGLSNTTIMTVAAVTLVGLVVSTALGRAMDVATFSDTEAQSLGLNMGQLRGVLFLISSVLTGGAVVIAGPVAFVGLICPHVARLLVGPSHRALLIASALVGATLILLADSASAAMAMSLGLGVIPIGIFTAVLGGPAFLWMLRPQLGRGSE